MSTISHISFHFLYPVHLKHRRHVKEMLCHIAKREKKGISHLNYVFCSDHYLLKMNEEYLNHSSLTDVITFDLSEEGEPLVSDVYISVQRVRENAALYHSTIKQELLRVMVHGLLHLCGYNDKLSRDKKVMREKESMYLKMFSVPRETEHRSI